MLRRYWLFFAWFVIAGFTLPAQEGGIRIPIPEKIERATKADDKGVLQWEAWPDVKCPNCNGSGKAKCTTCTRLMEELGCPECKRNKERTVTCRVCAGAGKLPDPLEKVLCPGCQGAGFLLCMVCGGGGGMKIDKAKQVSKCPACGGDGAWKCAGCSGNRLVEVAAVKPSLKDGTAPNLAKAIAATDQTLKDLEAFVPAGGDKARKEMKALSKVLETAGAVHPAIKRMPKAFEDYMGKIFAGAQFQGYAETQANAMNLVKNNTEYYLKHQKRMMELAQKRAEANEKLAGEQKGK